jgi:hypothetical protein
MFVDLRRRINLRSKSYRSLRDGSFLAFTPDDFGAAAHLLFASIGTCGAVALTKAIHSRFVFYSRPFVVPIRGPHSRFLLGGFAALREIFPANPGD